MIAAIQNALWPLPVILVAIAFALVAVAITESKWDR